MLNQGWLKTIVLSALVLIAPAGRAFAFDDGFGTAQRISGQYFTIFYEPEVDIPALAAQLDIGAKDRLLAGQTAKAKFLQQQELAGMLDTLFIMVCDILDMRLYNRFQGKIKICRNSQVLSRIYLELLSEQPPNSLPFYIHQFNTIYISAENFSLPVLGHEIAHAVISNYFVVLPSAKTQEILAGYVEYQLRKGAGN